MQRPKQHSRQSSAVQVWETNTRTSPIQHARIGRRDDVSVVTSSYGGKLIPLKMIPLLREDALNSGTMNINVQMAETAAMLLNPVRISVGAYLVPRLAFDRFQDMGTIDRSYNGQPESDGTTYVNWFETHDPANTPIYDTLGIHFNAAETYNTDYLEAYNAVWNYIAANRSPSLTLRDKLDGSLADAFWSNTQMKHVVPTFDDAMLEGAIQIVTNGEIPVTRVSNASAWKMFDNGTDNQTGGTADLTKTAGHSVSLSGGSDQSLDPNGGLIADLAQLTGGGFSLAAIDQARQTAEWARMRTQFQGKDDDWIIDQLLSGIRFNDDAMKQPIMLDSQETTVGMSQRYATDSANLTKSVVDGRTSLQLRLGSPQIPCGGVVVIVAQALPEQVFERQRDHYLALSLPSELPNRTADELDPQPVAMVKNVEVDEAHTLPDDLFGYAPLNWEWQRQAPNVGGRYLKRDPLAAWDEDRNRIWDSGAVDPALGPDFYLSTQLQHQVFESANEEPFEWWVNGSVNISGLTYFGPSIRESQGDYDAVRSQIDETRLVGDGTDLPT